ncbi:hypothetical protein [Gracilibacillus alcaliphilus]|uniref:hypothetical protein n=1 Tax=Gracilibacillus alcaliphilus TaxID=1401441 RepID=UPI001958F197|nr:hypothetical protein [Gracilibacillus alcaliphilus]MBM7679558.1 hypothetical protein [Gracilibacillus alcaliphilus]
MMSFKDQFKSEDQRKALQYRNAIERHLNDSLTCLDNFELDKSRQLFDQAVLLLGELRIMSNQHENNDKMMTDHAMEIRRNHF